MTNNFADNLAECFATGHKQILRVPVLVKGRLLFPPRFDFDRLIAAANSAGGPAAGSRDNGTVVFSLEEAWVIRQPLADRLASGSSREYRFLVLANPDPHDLIETDQQQLARGLYALPFREILRYTAALREVLQQSYESLRQAEAQTPGGFFSPHEQLEDLWLDYLPALLDPAGLEAMVDQQLGSSEVAGRRFLDGWVEVEAAAQRGMTARAAEKVAPGMPAANAFRPQVRAMPTRQLHITAGNSPVVPFVSFLYGLATKGALVIKSPAEATAPAAVLAMAMCAVDPEHPITRSTSLVYWKGGDRPVEDVLFTDKAFDRLVVWGSPETVGSVRARALSCKTVYFNPRYGLSVIGRAAFPDHVDEAAARACADSLIANQRACMSSLVHYVEGDEQQVLAYCRALQRTLARWDEQVPHVVPRAVLGQLRLLRRTAFLQGTWFENGTPPFVSSAVVYLREPFDLAVHPMSRCIVVRRLDNLDQVVPFLNSAVAAIGVYPGGALASLRDVCAAAGVSNIAPLGECERIYAGMPHDGMKVLSELVNWTKSGTSAE